VALIVGGGHAHPANQPASGSPAGTRALTAELAVLRRPQSAADRALEHAAIANVPPPAQRIPSLTRLVASTAGIKIYLVVNKAGSDAQSPALGAQATIVTVTRHGAAEGPGFPAEAIRHGAGRFLPVPLAGPGRVVSGIQIVPDDVASAQVHFNRNGGVSYIRPKSNVLLVPPIDRYGKVIRIEWLNRRGEIVSSAEPAPPETLAQLMSGQSDTLIGEYQQRPHPAAPGLLEDFPTFAHGAYRSATLTVATPTLAELPQLLLGLHREPDLNGIRHVTTPSGVDLWFIPARHTACQAEATNVSSTGACARNVAQIEAQGLWTYQRRPHAAGFFLVGLVPRTNATVTLTLSDGGTRTVPVVDGVVVTTAQGVKTIQLRSATGRPAEVRAGPEVGPARISLY
jgi:hypothetical protein